MMNLFGFLAGPLGWVLKLVYGWVNDYFLAIFVFTFLMRLVTFPLQLQSHKKQMDRVRLAPRVERLQKKYKDDPQLFQKKQQALYEKEGVSLTGGCLPMIITMILLFGIIEVIYRPLTYLSDVPKNVTQAAISASTIDTYTDKDSGYTVNKEKTQAVTTVNGEEITVDLTTKFREDKYYGEMKMLSAMDKNHDDIIRAIQAETNAETGKNYTEAEAEKYFDMLGDERSQFDMGKYSLLDKPWSGWNGISILWLIPLISGLTAVLASIVSMHFSKQGMSSEKQPGQGCSNGMMILFMPLFSLYITFTVPGGVGIYWICSNIISILQTYVLNMIYNPKKIREQAEIDYQERRRRRAEEKKKNTLADARRRDDERERAEDEAAAAAAEAEKNQPKGKKKNKKEKDIGLEVGKIKDED